MLKRRSIPAPLRAQGFTLLEVLIALLVLSLGLLGLAGLQTFGLRYTSQSYERTQATALIYEIADRMRANPTGLANYIYPGDGSLTNAVPAYTTDCQANGCPALELAEWDLNQWYTRIMGQRNLSGATAAISLVGGTTGLYRIDLNWTQNDLTATQHVEIQLPGPAG